MVALAIIIIFSIIMFMIINGLSTKTEKHTFEFTSPSGQKIRIVSDKDQIDGIPIERIIPDEINFTDVTTHSTQKIDCKVYKVTNDGIVDKQINKVIVDGVEVSNKEATNYYSKDDPMYDNIIDNNPITEIESTFSKINKSDEL